MSRQAVKNEPGRTEANKRINVKEMIEISLVDRRAKGKENGRN